MDAEATLNGLLLVAAEGMVGLARAASDVPAAGVDSAGSGLLHPPSSPAAGGALLESGCLAT